MQLRKYCETSKLAHRDRITLNTSRPVWAEPLMFVPLQVLVVDDDALSCRRIVVILKRLGHLTWSAKSLQESSFQFEIQSFDLIVTKYHLSGESDERRDARIKSWQESSKVIAVTANIELESNVGDKLFFLTAPFQQIELEQLVDALFV